MDITRIIKQKAIELGFDLVGITTSEPVDQGEIDCFQEWLADGFAGEMGYMHRNLEKRFDPAKLLNGARSVICVGLNYRPAIESARADAPGKATGVVANFALYEDYHQFIKKRLFKLAEFIKDAFGPAGFKFKACVDSVPLAERALAQRAGLGFIGKNRMLINPKLGSQILLGELITSLELEQDEGMACQCSGCDKCISACPTGALTSSGRLDASKCISYLTIEYHGDIPVTFASKIGRCLFGCDSCIKACPFEDNTPSCSNSAFGYRSERQAVNIEDILNWNEDDFARLFAGSPVERVGLERLKRNARICSKA